MKYTRGTTKNAATVLREGVDTFIQNNKKYGDTMVVVGYVMQALFPNGIVLKSSEDFRRFHLLEWMIGKIVRYAQVFNEGGHRDSIFDACIYAAMLTLEDDLLNEGDENV